MDDKDNLNASQCHIRTMLETLGFGYIWITHEYSNTVNIR